MLVNSENFQDYFSQNLLAPRSTHNTELSKLKDILANKIFKGDSLVHLAQIAGVEQLDMKSQTQVDAYVKRCAAVAREILFDEDQNVQPWLMKALRYHGYKGEFDEQFKKDAMNGTLFQLVQSSASKYFTPEYKKSGQTDLFNMLKKNLRRAQCVWTGYKDRQTNTQEQPDRTAKQMLDEIDRDSAYDDLRDLVPEVDASLIDSAMLVNSKNQFEKKFIDKATSLSNSFRAQSLGKIAKQCIFPDKGAFHMAVLAGVDGVDMSDREEVDNYIRRCTQLASKMLLDGNNEVKPWVKMLCRKNGYKGDFNQADVKDLIHKSVKQMVKVGLKEYYQHEYNSEDTKHIYKEGMQMVNARLADFFQPKLDNWDVNFILFDAQFAKFDGKIDDIVPNPLTSELEHDITPKQFTDLMRRDMEITQSSHNSGASKIKDIIANHVLTGGILDSLIDIAKIHEVDLESDESIEHYVERSAAVVAQFMFDEDHQVRPWLKDVLRSSGYNDSFDDAISKKIISASLFQMVQCGIGSRFVNEYMDPDPKEQTKKLKHFTQRRMDVRRIQSEWTGSADNQTKVEEDPSRTAESILEQSFAAPLQSIRDEVPEYNPEYARTAIMKLSRDNFERDFARELSQSTDLPATRYNQRASDIIQLKLLTNNLSIELGNIMKLHALDVYDYDQVATYADKCMALSCGLLFDDDNQVKPWVKELFASQGYNGDMDSSEFKDQLLKEVSSQLLDRNMEHRYNNFPEDQQNRGELLKTMYHGKQRIAKSIGVADRALKVAAVDDWGVDQVLFSMRTDSKLKPIMNMAPDPSSEELIKTLARENLKTIMRNIELDTKTKWKFKSRSRYNIKLGDKKYPVPKRLYKTYNLIKEGLANEKDPLEICQQAEKIIASKTSGDMKGVDQKTQEAYQNIHKQLKSEHVHREVVAQRQVAKLSQRRSISM